jgi:CubicO group peptidase (beta-lactamase class C family)
VWIDSDGIVFLQSGVLARSNPRPISPDTQFEIGSVTKVFTALLLLGSERFGKVSRNDPAAKFLLSPNDPAQAMLSKITLLALATHTSGLPRLPSNFGPHPETKSDPYASYDRSQLIDALRLDGGKTLNGGTMNYSNFGAAVLGESLAAAWGTTYAGALQDHVLKPLGMTSTSLGLAGVLPPVNISPGHANGKTVPNWTFKAFAPAGALRSSARDLGIFLSALLGYNETILRASINASLQPQYAADEVGGHIGAGWLLTDDTEKQVVWHNGATAGSHALIAFCPKTGVGLAILANVQKACEPLGFGLLGTKPPHPNTAIVKDAADYVGRYAITPKFVLTVTEEQEMLYVQATAQGKLPVFPSARDEFFYKAVDAQISFQRDPAGTVTGLVLHQGARNLPAKKATN